MAQIKLSGNVRVSDPCYTDDVWCKTRLTNVLPGTYNVEVDKRDTDGWGERVWSITTVHESIVDDGISLEWEDHSEIGVDSGQAGIFCETSYRNDEIASGITTPPVNFSLGGFANEDINNGDAWYEKMCKFTLGEQSWGVYDTGVVSSSGIGDGSYALEVLRDVDKIVCIKLTFLYEDEFDEEDEEEFNEYEEN